MTDDRSDAEKAVDDLNRLRKRSSELEKVLRDLRLGRQAELRFKTLSLAFWNLFHTERAERMPQAMSAEFYSFISDKKSAVDSQIRDAERDLRKVQIHE